MPRIVKSLLLSVFLLGAGLLACATRSSQRCEAPDLSRQALINIVESEVRRRGGNPKPDRRTQIKVRRDGCDYVYQEVAVPKRPGDFLVVRINQFGEVTEFFPGL